MDLVGHIQNGVVVLEGDVLLPEGAAVTVTPRSGLVIRVAKNRKRVELPLVKSDQPGTLDLSNDRIAEILEAEDIEAIKAQWNAPPGRLCLAGARLSTPSPSPTGNRLVHGRTGR